MNRYNTSMAIGYWLFVTVFILCITAAAMYFDNMFVLICWLLPISIRLEVKEDYNEMSDYTSDKEKDI